jgi:hypothetical protein
MKMKQNLSGLGTVIGKEKAKKIAGGGDPDLWGCSGRCFLDIDCAMGCRCKYKSYGGSSVCYSGFPSTTIGN